MRKILILLTGIMVFGVTGIARADSVLLDFEDLPLSVGSTNTYDSNATTPAPGALNTWGTLTKSSGSTGQVKATITVGQFDWGGGVWTNRGVLMVENGGIAGGTGKELHTDNVNLAVKFGSGVELTKFSFLFGEYGGGLNLGINGHFETLQNFDEAPAIPFPGVVVNVTGAGATGQGKGKIEIEGIIEEHTYDCNGVLHSATVVVGGGQELWIDNITAEGVEGIFAPSKIPTVSEWGLIVMALLIVTAGAIVIVRRSRRVAT
jgi:hypothetical protein